MNLGVQVRRGATVVSSVSPRIGFALVNKVEVKFASDRLAKHLWFRAQPAYGKQAVDWWSDEGHGQPLVVTGVRGVTVATLDVLAGAIYMALVPPTSWTLPLAFAG
jgi:hypothetical protein